MKYKWYYLLRVLDKKQIKNINKIFNIHSVDNLDSPAGGLKTCEVNFTQWKNLKNVAPNIEGTINWANKNFFGFNTYPLTLEDSITRNTYVYKNKGCYDYHQDGEKWDQQIYTSKLTCLINISEEKYEGGEFYIFDGLDCKIENFDTPGSLIIFPSFMFHKVSPVLKGTRKTMSIWITGRPWQ